MIYQYKYYENRMKTPQVVLCDYLRNPVGSLKVYDFQGAVKWQDISEFTFNVPRLYLNINTGEKTKNPYYDIVEGQMWTHIIGFGYFRIKNTSIEKNGSYEYKHVTIASAEYDMTKKNVSNLIINMGTTGSLDDVVLCLPSDDSGNRLTHSLLDIVLQEFPDWTFPTHTRDRFNLLLNEKRSFKTDKKSVYSFLMEDVANAFGVVVEFDVENLQVHITPIDYVGDNTNIIISTDNLAESVSLDYSEENIVTSLTCVGGDDMTFRSQNFGSNVIFNYDYFMTASKVGQELHDAFEDYKTYRNQQISAYATYYEYLNQINLEYGNFMNSVPSTDYQGDLEPSDYTLIRLMYNTASSDRTGKFGCYNWWNSQYDKFNSLITMSRNYGWDTQTVGENNAADDVEEHYNAYRRYLVRKTRIEYLLALRITELGANTNIDSSFTARSNLTLAEIKTEYERRIQVCTNYMQTIAYNVSIYGYFNNENHYYPQMVSMLSNITIQDELSDDGFVVTDGMWNNNEGADAIAMISAFKERCELELEQMASPQIVFNAILGNLFNIKEFKTIRNDFALGNYIYTTIRPDYVKKVRLHEIHFNFNDTKDFSAVFSNLAKLNDYINQLGKVWKISYKKIKNIANAGM